MAKNYSINNWLNLKTRFVCKKTQKTKEIKAWIIIDNFPATIVVDFCFMMFTQ